jgi:hypothetical protein
LATFVATVGLVVLETGRELAPTNSGPHIGITLQIFAFVELSATVTPLTAVEPATFAATVGLVVLETGGKLSSTNSSPNVGIAAQIIAFIEVRL